MFRGDNSSWEVVSLLLSVAPTKRAGYQLMCKASTVAEGSRDCFSCPLAGRRLLNYDGSDGLSDIDFLFGQILPDKIFSDISLLLVAW